MLDRLAVAALLLCAGACEQQGRSDADAPGEAVAVSAQELVLAPMTASADTTLRSGVPYGNDGTGLTLGVTAVSVADVKRSLVKFSQPSIQASIPANQVLYSARLDLTIAGVSAGWFGGAVDILPMIKAWPEGTGLLGNGPSWVCSNDINTTLFGNLTNDCTNDKGWSMLPGGQFTQPFSPMATDRVPIFTGGLGTISFDVTADVQRFLYTPGAINNGWMLAAAPNLAGAVWVNFGSRESAQKPKLILETGPDLCLNNPLKGTPGQCGCDIPDLDTNLDNVPDCFDAVATVTADTTLRLAVPFGNDGTGTLLGVTSASIVDLERSLVKIDSDAIEAVRGGRAVMKAYLELTVAGIAVGWAGGSLELSRMKPLWDWQEGNGLAGHGASWSCADDTNTTLLGNLVNDCTTANKWGMQLSNSLPRPFEPTPSATTGLVWPGMTTVRFDVTTDVQSFLQDPTQNRGWLIQGAATTLLSGSWVNFGSRESGAPPRLLLDLGDDVDMQSCAESVKPRADLTGAARERAYQAEIIRRCIDPGASACLNDLRGRVNIDLFSIGLALASQTTTPAQLLAVSRDRRRKARAFEADPVLASALCTGDTDGDFVPNTVDACPATPPLTPTDAVGCTDSSVPPAPSPADVATVLDKMGIAIAPACSGAAVYPKTSHGAIYWPSTPKLQDLGVFVFAGRVTNQPAGCPVWYVFEVEELVTASTPSGYQAVQRYRVAFKDSEEMPALIGTSETVPAGVIQFQARPGDVGTRGLLGGAGIKVLFQGVNAVRFRLMVMNGAAMKSDWSEWSISSKADCEALGIVCN